MVDQGEFTAAPVESPRVFYEIGACGRSKIVFQLVFTYYLKNNGLLEPAQTIANHSSPRTTKLYDRRSDEISLDEVEKISI